MAGAERSRAGGSDPGAVRGRRRATRLAAVAAVAVGALAVAVPAVLAVRISRIHYNAGILEASDPQATARWGERLAGAEDLNGDGVDDYFVGVPSLTVGGVNNAERVYLVSGRTRTVIRTMDSPEPQANAQFGFYINVLGDVDGDRRDDIAIGTDAQDVAGNVDQGKAWVFSGLDGRMLHALDNPKPQRNARFGSRIGRAGDLTGDGRSEVILGASNNDLPAGCGEQGSVPVNCRRNEGEAFIFNGATGALVRTLNMPAADRTPATCTSNCGTFGLAVQGPCDTNADGVVDQLVDAGSFNASSGRMYLFDGKTGALRLKIDNPRPQTGATFGFQDAAPLSPGDVNGDGFADLYANGFNQDVQTNGDAQGRAWVFNGQTGALLYELNDPSPEFGGQFGWALARTDFNRDERPDLYVGSSPHHGGGSQIGGTYVFRGEDGQLLKALERPESDPQAAGSFTNLGPNLGWGLAAPGDLNGDRQPDYLGGAPFTDVGGSQDQGKVYAFLSRLRRVGRCPNVLRGTRGRDRLHGTALGDLLLGGADRDVLTGYEGRDCLAGGSGNDSIRAADGTRDRVNCGSGRDSVRADRSDRLLGCERVRRVRRSG